MPGGRELLLGPWVQTTVALAYRGNFRVSLFDGFVRLL